MRILAFWVAKNGKPSSLSGMEFGVLKGMGLLLEHIDAESYQGRQLVQQYRINSFPAIVALSKTGMVLQTWYGYDQPTRDQLKYYIDRGQ